MILYSWWRSLNLPVPVDVGVECFSANSVFIQDKLLISPFCGSINFDENIVYVNICLRQPKFPRKHALNATEYANESLFFFCINCL